MIFYVTQATYIVDGVNATTHSENQNAWFTVRADAITTGKLLVKNSPNVHNVAVYRIAVNGKDEVRELLDFASGHVTMHAAAEMVWSHTEPNPDGFEDMLS